VIYTLERISKHYPTREGSTLRALDELSLGVREGEQLALIGKSGAGKSTLFRLLNATLRPTSGTLLFADRDTGALGGRELRALRRRIGTIHQQHQLVPSLSVLDNALCGKLGGWSLFQTLKNTVRPGRAEVEEALHALEQVGLADRRRARADELSGGQQQRLAIARMLMQDPDVILADEPVASLDPALSEAITSLLVRLAETEGRRRTLVVALHTVELALAHFPRIIALGDGRVAFDAPPQGIGAGALAELYRGDDPGRTDGKERGDVDPFGFSAHCAR
jgi:phosphonate transport system ATP-binding protein